MIFGSFRQQVLSIERAVGSNSSCFTHSSMPWHILGGGLTTLASPSPLHARFSLPRLAIPFAFYKSRITSNSFFYSSCLFYIPPFRKTWGTLIFILFCNSQTYNAGLNFANVDEALNFFSVIKKKLDEKEQRRGQKIFT